MFKSADEARQQRDQYLVSPEITDEMHIQMVIDEFYEYAKTFDGDPEKLLRMKLIRNNLINITHSYLKKFRNEGIMLDFYKRLREAKLRAMIDSRRVNKYQQYMNEVRVVQEFKGVRENIAEKLAEQLFKLFKNSEEVKNNGVEEKTDGNRN